MKKSNRLLRLLMFISAATISLSVKLFPVISQTETVSIYSTSTTVYELNKSMQKTESMLEELVEEVERQSVEELPFQTISIHPNMSIKSLTNFTEAQYNIMLRDTPLFGHGKSFVKVEKEHGVNGLFMVALTGQEQGFGTGEIARTKNNITSYMAYDHDKNMAYTFKSYEHCLLVTAKLLEKHYLSEDGDYFNGVTPAAINIRYASDTNWSNKILQIMERLQNKLVAEYDVDY